MSKKDQLQLREIGAYLPLASVGYGRSIAAGLFTDSRMEAVVKICRRRRRSRTKRSGSCNVNVIVNTDDKISIYMGMTWDLNPEE